MSRREDEKFAEWASDFERALPEDKRAAWRELANTDVAREELFRGTLRTRDYYTRLNEINEREQTVKKLQDELYAWYEEQLPKNEALLAERDLLRAQLDEVGNEIPAAAGLPGGLSTEDLASIKAKADKVDMLDKMLPDILGDIAAFTKDSIKEGFDVDPREVMRLSLQQGVRPYRAYETMTASERAKRYEKERDEERKKWFEEGRRAAGSASTGSPDHIQPSGPSAVDFLRDSSRGETSQHDRVRAALEALEAGSF
jgi:hypothetical protein